MKKGGLLACIQALVRLTFMVPLFPVSFLWKDKQHRRSAVSPAASLQYRRGREKGACQAVRWLLLYHEKKRQSRSKAALRGTVRGRPLQVHVGKRSVSSRTRIVVVRSNRTLAGTWVTERRDVLSDYRRFFDDHATPVARGIAVLTDSDNTHSRAVGDYADIETLAPVCLENAAPIKP